MGAEHGPPFGRSRAWVWLYVVAVILILALALVGGGVSAPAGIR
jgi:hypothetical protein